MRRRLLGLTATAIVAVSIWWVTAPAEHVPPYDALLTRLAETEREAYCSGWAMMTAASSTEASGLVKECRDGERPDMVVVLRTPIQPLRLKEWSVVRIEVKLSDEPDLDSVGPAFCAGLVRAGWNKYSGRTDKNLINACEFILRQDRLWPTLDAGITNSWDEKWAYPGESDDDLLEGTI